MGNRAVKSVLDDIERKQNRAVAEALERQWDEALTLWCEEYEFWENFHRKSCQLGNVKQPDDVFQETVCERILRILPMRIRKEKIDLRSAVEVVSGTGGK
jgi:translation initiation factor 2 alpha subunit (eIF-2alpha)